jgi:hypothetical protein
VDRIRVDRIRVDGVRVDRSHAAVSFPETATVDRPSLALQAMPRRQYRVFGRLSDAAALSARYGAPLGQTPSSARCLRSSASSGRDSMAMSASIASPFHLPVPGESVSARC